MKSLIKTLFWVLLVTCLFQYSLMLPTYAVEKKADKLATTYATQFPVEQQATIKEQFVRNYLSAMAEEPVLRIPYVTALSYNDLKEQQLQLGLDLKGGMQLVLGMDKEAFLKQLVNHSTHPSFEKALALTNEQIEQIDPNYIAVFFENFQTFEQEENIVRLFLQSNLLKDALSQETDIRMLQKEVTALVTTTLLTTQYQLGERLNSVGLSQPNISADISKQHLHIEIPGAQDPERIRSMVTATASLEFWETYRITDKGILEAFVEADQMLLNEK